ncbi:MAG: CoA transferase [Dehalococcoidia bacterium]|nr:CoA transferase [Dehalococcoidia bacterium]
MKKILEGIKVIDWGQWVAVPQAAAYLGDLGADVYHLEQKGVGDQFRGMRAFGGVSMILPQGINVVFETDNRNKRGLALDMKKPSGKEILHRLIKNSDVFMTNIEPDTINRFGMDYPTLSRINPKLVYARMSGYGEKGPDADMPSFDNMFQARAGIMMTAGDGSSQEPCLPAVFVGDEVAAMMVTSGVLAALLARERHGIGQEVKISGLRATMQLVDQWINMYLLTGKELRRTELHNPLSAVFHYYQCKDGIWIALAAQRAIDWGPLCKAIDMPELEKDPRFDKLEKRMQNPELARTLEGAFQRKTSEQWMEVFRKSRLAAGAVNTIARVVSDPQVVANEYICDYDHPVLGKIKVLGPTWDFTKTPAGRTRPAPECGQHTEEILTEVCGYTWDDIARFQEEGAI